MLSPLTTLRDSSRVFLGASALALIVLMAGLFAIATGFSGGQREQGALRTSGEAVSRLHLAAPPARTALADNRSAHRRMNVRHNRVADSVKAEAIEATPPPTTGEPSHQLTAIESPAATPASPPPAPSAPALPPSPKPAPEPPPAPGPAPEPPPNPAPEPPPPPKPAPEPPPPPKPAPEPPPIPSKEPPQPQPSGEVLFRATFDSGFGGWYVQSLKGRATLSSDPFEGSRAARFEVRDGDVEPDTGSERSEVSGPTFDEGEDLYIRDAIRVPADATFEGPWQIIQQLHEEDWSGSPGMAVFLNSEPALRLGAGDGSPTFWTSPQLAKDRWYELIYRVNLSQSPSSGFVEVWLDRVRQTLANGQTRIYGQTIQASQTYIKAGIYRSKSSTGTSIVEHDSIVIGTSLAAVTG